MKDMIGYEERDPAVVQHIASGYPRFVLHPCLCQLTSHLLRRHRLTGQTLWLTASTRSAAELAAHLALMPAGQGGQIRRFSDGDLCGVTHPENPDMFTAAKTLLQNTGMFLSSRAAEDALVRLGVLAAAEPEALYAGDTVAEIKRVLRRALPGADDADLFPACSGMNAIYAAYRAVSELQAARGRTIWVQLGWLYRDTTALLKRFATDPARDYIYLQNVGDFGALERLFSEKGRQIAGLFAEAPTNPLIQTPDVPALAALVRRHGAKLILDPSIASLFCVDVLAQTDVLVNSLTKFAANCGDVMAGLVVINPAGPDVAALRRGVARWLEPVYPRDLARLAVEIGDFERFVAQLNAATPKIATWLEAHPKVKRVYWALSPDSRSNYLRIARSRESVGSMLSALGRKFGDVLMPRITPPPP
jgi:cystathionine gamma-synthase